MTLSATILKAASDILRKILKSFTIRKNVLKLTSDFLKKVLKFFLTPPLSPPPKKKNGWDIYAAFFLNEFISFFITNVVHYCV